MTELPGPYEFWDMEAGETRSVHVMRWEEGTVKIRPRYAGAPISKEVQCLRLHVWNTDKEFLPYYWDITSKHLIAGLKGHLTQSDHTDKIYTISKHGVAPRARFTLAVERYQ